MLVVGWLRVEADLHFLMGLKVGGFGNAVGVESNSLRGGEVHLNSSERKYHYE